MELPIQPIYQGRTNGCGTASLAMALNCLAEPDTPPFTQAMLDQEYRKLDSFCAPHMLLRAARKYGFQGQIYNRATLPEIISHLEAKRPILGLHSENGTIHDSHYVVISGYQPGETEADTKLILWDPITRCNQRKVTGYREFVKQYWQPFKAFGIPTGLERTILVFSRLGHLLPKREVPWSLHAAFLLNRLLNTLSPVLEPLQKLGGRFKSRSKPPGGPGLQ